jgi:hypothetical protein
MLHSSDLDFSFSGLKTAVLARVKAAEQQGGLDEQTRADLSAATQAAIVDVLAAKSIKALKQTGLKRLVVAGGVGANSLLRGGRARQAWVGCLGEGQSRLHRAAALGSRRHLRGLKSRAAQSCAPAGPVFRSGQYSNQRKWIQDLPRP